MCTVSMYLYVHIIMHPCVCVCVPGPNDQTVEDFWRMVWQLRPPTVVMITNVMEGSKFKCEQYWPEYGSMVCGSFKVVLADQQVFANFTVRTLLLSVSRPTRDAALRLNPSLSPPHPSPLPPPRQMVSKANLTPFKVLQFHFTTWPDHGVPDYVTPMLNFHRRTMAEHRPTKGPMVVHCR